MGFLAELLCFGLTASAVKTITHNITENIKRKNTVCHFDGDISKEEFYAMVRRSGKKIRRITNLYADGTMVYGTVCSQSGISDWNFKIDFNDYGKLTGTYWLSSDNDDSNIPEIVADKIAQQIKTYPDCCDASFARDLHKEKTQEELRKQAGAYCPYCGSRNYNKNAKFCANCGMRFRV